MSSSHERETRERFADRYRLQFPPILQEIERVVLGGVWGANGYTTIDEADRLGALLELTPDKTLLDIGTGRGWPGIYLAQRSGCDVVLTDLPIEGLLLAGDRAVAEEVSSLGAVASSARHPPFKRGSFDAIVHTDVMC